MTEEEFPLFHACTGREKFPDGEFKELWAIVGRRAGKSFTAAVVAVYLTLFHKYEQHLGPGEVGTIQVIASDRSQAQVILNYVRGILKANPVFSQYINAEYKETIQQYFGRAGKFFALWATQSWRSGWSSPRRLTRTRRMILRE